jgi:hypothetical protein
MPCTSVWVTNFETNEQYFSRICWPGGIEGVNEPPDTGGGGGGSEGGITTGQPIPGPVFDPGDGDGTILISGPEDEDSAKPLTVSPNPGWNGGAYSIESVPPNWRGMISFDLPDVQGVRQGGVAVGLVPVSNLPTVGRSGYDHMPYGLVVTSDYIRVIHAGEVVIDWEYEANIRDIRPPGAATDAVKVLMYGRLIKWTVNGEMLFVGAFSMPEPYSLDATLYLAYDSVNNPKFEEGDWGDLEDGSYVGLFPGLEMEVDMTPADFLDGQLPALAMQYSEQIVWSMQGTLRGLTCDAGDIDGIRASLPGLQMIASDVPGYTPYTGTFKSLTMHAALGIPDSSVDYSVYFAAMRGLQMDIGIAPFTKLEGAFKPLQMIATFDSSYFEIRATLPSLRMNAYGGGITPLIQIVETMGARIPVYQSVYVALVLVERVGGAVEAIGYATVTAEAVETISAQDTTSYDATILDAMMETLGLGERVVVLSHRAASDALVDDGEAWVVNTRTQASSRYDTYGFNSFASVGGKNFGVRTDGVYLLEGDTDSGQPILSGINLGQHDFGSQALKRLPAVHVGVSSMGTMFLKVGDGVHSYTYRARRSDPRMKVQRFDPGRGLQANYFTFELTGEGDAFELDTVKFDVVASQRRI